jgi:hypothetical protein
MRKKRPFPTAWRRGQIDRADRRVRFNIVAGSLRNLNYASTLSIQARRRLGIGQKETSSGYSGFRMNSLRSECDFPLKLELAILVDRMGRRRESL